jgi:hypothetical protein
MRITNTEVLEGEPRELDEFMNGPKPPQNPAQDEADHLAIQMLVRRTDELSKAMEVFLNGDKGHKKAGQASKGENK